MQEIVSSRRRRLRIVLALVVVGLSALALWAYLSGDWVPNHPSLKKFPVRGIDISHHQEAIEWGKVKSAGIQFAYLKATEGGDLVDRQFPANWNASREAGLTRGAYHFFTLKTPGADQARNFMAVVPAEPDTLPPAIDLEFSGNSRNLPAAADFQRELSEFISQIRARYGREPVIYTTYGFRDRYLKNFPVRRLWLRDVVTTPRFHGNPDWTFWQFSDRGKVPGVSGFCDLDVFAGAPDKFDSLLR